MSAYTNMTGVPLSIAVYLASDFYDYDPTAVSTTTLIKPIRQTILAARVPAAERAVDVLSLVKNKTGSAIHDSIERAWKENRKPAMLALGYPEDVIDKILINPEPEQIKPDSIPVYMEKRSYRELNGVTISGKFDFVAEGRLEDFKNTTVFTYIKDTKDKDYQLQGSIYRWLNPTLIVEDHMAIQFIFSDWMPGKALSDPNYPKRATEERLIPLLSLDETEQYISNRIETLTRLWSAPQSELPLCTDDELWRQAPQVKYYKNPQKMTRSTKNFDEHESHEQNLAEAYARKVADGNVGIVLVKPGLVNACKYCRAFPVCQQKDVLIVSGDLVI